MNFKGFISIIGTLSLFVPIGVQSFVPIGVQSFVPAVARASALKHNHKVLHADAGAGDDITFDDKLGASDITFDDIQPGDIISFSPADDVVSQLITSMTGEDFSHSAMVSSDPSMIVQSILSGATKSILNDPGFSKRRVTVSRLNGVDLEKVYEAGDFYVEQKMPYGSADLIWVGILLVRQNPRVLLNPGIISGIYALLKMFTESKKTPSSPNTSKPDAMFCSQFVYQLYADGGHTLEIDGPTIGTMADSSEDSICVLDAVLELVERDSLTAIPSMTTTSTAVSSSTRSEVVQELYEAITSVGDITSAAALGISEAEGEMKVAVDPELAQLIVSFALEFENAMPVADDNAFESMAVPTTEKDRAIMALRKLKKANFVTPGDLTRIANENAQLVGSLTFE